MIRTAVFCLAISAFPAFATAGIVVGNPADTFQISFDGTDSFLLRTDPADDYSPDPIVYLTAGETYAFQHTGAMHPFAFLDDAAPIDATSSGVDGSEFVRTVTDSSFFSNVLDGGSMVVWPVGSSMGSDSVSWIPEEGTYYYTCGVAGHANMAGQIIVQAASSAVPEPAALVTALAGLGVLLAMRRRH